MQGSWTLTRGHVLEILGVCVVLALINLAGILPGLGVLVTAPMISRPPDPLYLLGGIILFGLGPVCTIPFTTLTVSAGYLFVAGLRPPLEAPARSNLV